MKKKIIRINLGDKKHFDASLGNSHHTPIDEIIQWLLEVQSSGATHIDLYARSDYEGASDGVEAQAFYEYEETEEQCLERMHNEKEIKEERKRENIKAMNKLYTEFKKEFGDI